MGARHTLRGHLMLKGQLEEKFSVVLKTYASRADRRVEERLFIPNLRAERGGVTEVIGWPLGVMPVRVLEYVFDSNMGNKISPDIGNCQGALPV